ncbi:hypothetical protein [Nakamurella multipartita]|uniref:hypothetical protein n=1 Tax=Nakamurella multipartita TaxID=53461 RepID=UPI0010FEE6D0|nr:hypothetical protein [Nakamurella multipartita]
MSWLPDRLVPDGPTHAAVGAHVGGANLYAALYAESIQDDRQAREALFLTFNVDLGFFEQRVLGLCRGAGAAVTVVADASIYAPDVRAVHGAGTSYIVGLASMRGAFHPKLAILVGPERAVIGIGSGNVTVGGWHGNDEIFCVLRASVVDGVPAAVGALAGFLDRLPEVVDMAPSAAIATRRTSAELATLASRGRPLSTGPRLVSTLDRPLIDQLPAGKVSTLALYAPFHDPRGQALAALLARYAPDEVRIGVQPKSTVIHPAALVDVAAAAGVKLTFHQLEDVPYRHGKLIQASDQDGIAWSLTGSANLSAAALLGAVGQGGNCELGLVTERSAALYPPAVGELGHHEIEPRTIGPASIEGAPPASSSASHLLEAAVEGAQVRLSLSRAAREPLVVEASAYEDLPHNYRGWAVIPADQQQVRVARPEWLTAGSRIRLGRSPGGSPRDVFLLDPALALRRVQPGSSQSNTALQPFDIFADPGQAERWMAGMYKLLASQRITQTSRPRGASTKSVNQSEVRIPATTGWRTWDDPDEWARYSENAAIRLGEPLYRLGLGGLPRLKAKADTAELPGGRPIWDDRISGSSDLIGLRASDLRRRVG